MVYTKIFQRCKGKSFQSLHCKWRPYHHKPWIVAVDEDDLTYSGWCQIEYICNCWCQPFYCGIFVTIFNSLETEIANANEWKIILFIKKDIFQISE